MASVAIVARLHRHRRSDQRIDRRIRHTPPDAGDILHQAVPPPGRHKADLSIRLEEIILKCLEKDPGHRYQSVTDLLVDLRRLQRDSDAQALLQLAGSESATRPASRPARRWPPVAVALVTAAVLLVAAVLIYRTGPAGEAPDARPTRIRLENTRRLTSLPGNETQPTWSSDGNVVAFVSEISGNKDIWIKRVSGGAPIQVTDHPADEFDPDWSPDGSTLVFRSNRANGGLYTMPAFGGDATRLTDFGYYPRWSPDGSRILFQLSLPRLKARESVRRVG